MSAVPGVRPLFWLYVRVHMLREAEVGAVAVDTVIDSMFEALGEEPPEPAQPQADLQPFEWEDVEQLMSGDDTPQDDDDEILLLNLGREGRRFQAESGRHL
jgi:hypothetical protein